MPTLLCRTGIDDGVMLVEFCNQGGPPGRVGVAVVLGDYLHVGAVVEIVNERVVDAVHTGHSCQSGGRTATGGSGIVVHFEAYPTKVHQGCHSITLHFRRVFSGFVGHIFPVEVGVCEVGRLYTIVGGVVAVGPTTERREVPVFHHLRLRGGSTPCGGSFRTAPVVGFHLIPLGSQQRAYAILSHGAYLTVGKALPLLSISFAGLNLDAARCLYLELIGRQPLGQRRWQVCRIDGGSG